jgi:hypothetical protein
MELGLFTEFECPAGVSPATSLVTATLAAAAW